MAAPPAFATDRLQALIDSLPGQSVAAILVQADAPGTTWQGAAGVGDLATQTPAEPTAHFRIGSISKSFTAALVLLLVDAGQIELDAPLQSYLPHSLPPSDGPITIRQLLQHTSGLADYEQLLGMDRAATVVERRAEVYDLDALLALALDQPRLFPPGTDQAYASTNYLLLQALIEAVTGEPYGAALQRWVLLPAGLTQTFAPGADPTLPTPYLHGYVPVQQGGQATLVDISEWNPSVAGASGELISTLADLNQFLGALLAGEIVPPELLAEMLHPFADGQLGPGATYGLGITLLELPCGVTVYGHSGTVPGYIANLYGTRDGRRLAFALTPLGGGGPIGQALETLRVTAFCETP
jgi:D-alanyl-D-alanine carboxypeptidase